MVLWSLLLGMMMVIEQTLSPRRQEPERRSRDFMSTLESHDVHSVGKSFPIGLTLRALLLLPVFQGIQNSFLAATTKFKETHRAEDNPEDTASPGQVDMERGVPSRPVLREPTHWLVGTGEMSPGIQFMETLHVNRRGRTNLDTNTKSKQRIKRLSMMKEHSSGCGLKNRTVLDQ